MANKAVICVGVSASGKSTFARDWVAQDPDNRMEINRDNIRKILMNADGKEFSWATWDWKREGEVTRIVNEMIESASIHELNIIISDTILSKENHNRLCTWLDALGYEIEIKEFPVAIEEAWKRDAARENGVGHSVIATQYQKWLDYVGRATYTPKKHLPKCVLVDVDGTLAHMNGRRGPFDWHKVGVDEIDKAVRLIVNALSKQHGVKIIVLSGRDGICEPETREWLIDNRVEFDEIFMRDIGDIRKDTIVKKEIFERHIKDKYNVQFVIDDRPAVVRMWQELGLKTFIVGNPWIEF